KRTLRNRLLSLARAIGAPDAELLADQLVLLIDGAFANAQVMGAAGSAPALANAGKALVDLALKQAGSGGASP
ncbi:MAG TPA: TetR family transcriptional regulator, partial [Gammaproteobacteria bacterium]|nr:TetR family transcriptional regulator [Gammaproteobacteria bacterium]